MYIYFNFQQQRNSLTFGVYSFQSGVKGPFEFCMSSVNPFIPGEPSFIVKRIRRLGPPHLSIYCLIFKSKLLGIANDLILEDHPFYIMSTPKYSSIEECSWICYFIQLCVRSELRLCKGTKKTLHYVTWSRFVIIFLVIIDGNKIMYQKISTVIHNLYPLASKMELVLSYKDN